MASLTGHYVLTRSLPAQVWRSTVRASLLAGAFVLVAAPAHAGLTVCNQTPQDTSLALGQYNGTRWISRGWWSVQPGRCVELISGRLLARFYYLFATDGAFANWEGNKAFCVGLFKTFDVEGRGNCAARGLDQRGFLEIDTGNHLNWTQTLSNPR